MNIYFLGLILVMFRYFNKLSISLDTEKFATELARLSTRLYSLVDNDKIDPTDPHFIFLRDCMEEAVNNLQQLNLGVMIYDVFKNRKETYCSYAELENQFAYNEELKRIFRGYTNASIAYFKTKNRRAIFVFKVIVYPAKAIASLFYKSRGKSFISDFRKRFKVILLERSRGDLNFG